MHTWLQYCNGLIHVLFPRMIIKKKASEIFETHILISTTNNSCIEIISLLKLCMHILNSLTCYTSFILLATEYHLGLLKAKLAKYRQQLLEPTGKAGAKVI